MDRPRRLVNLTSLAALAAAFFLAYGMGFQSGRDRGMNDRMIDRHGGALTAEQLQAEIRRRQVERGEDEWGQPLPTTSPIAGATRRSD